MPDPTSDKPIAGGEPSTALQPIRPLRQQPAWRRAVHLVVKSLIIGIFGFFVLSVALVALIGWTGPPPTINMALNALDGGTIRQTWKPLSSISPNLARAVIAAEDTRFCSHQGFDLVEIQKAIEAAERGRNLRGASTISQQTAKNVFLYNGGGFARKGLEAWFTVLIETIWSKRRIMEIYLNIAEWGDGIYGAEAAAQARFGVSASKLTSRQSSLLAAVLPSPNRWKVTGRYAERRSGRIQAVMNAVRRDGLDQCLSKDK